VQKPQLGEGTGDDEGVADREDGKGSEESDAGCELDGDEQDGQYGQAEDDIVGRLRGANSMSATASGTARATTAAAAPLQRRWVSAGVRNRRPVM
jgi:hypothetical protein